MGLAVLAVQHHNGMSMGLLVNNGHRFSATVNAVPQANISHITQQDTFQMQVYLYK